MARILALDISGNHPSLADEGNGTTGAAIQFDDGSEKLFDVAAKDYGSVEEYWNSLGQTIAHLQPSHLVIEGYKLYNHKGKDASMQSHSVMPTSQLLGFLRMRAWFLGIPLTIQYASDVKTRWSDDVLEHMGLFERRGRNLYFSGEMTNPHKRDAYRHLKHFEKYKLPKMEVVE